MDQDKETLYQYQHFSLLEKEQITQWIQDHLFEIPIPDIIKDKGIKELLLGNFSFRSSLTIIRHAMYTLRIYPKY